MKIYKAINAEEHIHIMTDVVFSFGWVFDHRNAPVVTSMISTPETAAPLNNASVML